MKTPAGGALPAGKGATKARFPRPSAKGEPGALKNIVTAQVTGRVKVLTAGFSPLAASTQT